MPTCPGAPTVDQSIPGRPTDEPSGLQRLAVTYPPAHAAAVPLETRDVSMVLVIGANANLYSSLAGLRLSWSLSSLRLDFPTDHIFLLS